MTKEKNCTIQILSPTLLMRGDWVIKLSTALATGFEHQKNTILSKMYQGADLCKDTRKSCTNGKLQVQLGAKQLF